MTAPAPAAQAPLGPVLPAVAATTVAVAQYMAVSAAVKKSTKAFVIGRWRALDSWRDADAAKFVKDVVPVVLSGQSHVSALTDAYLSRMYEATANEPAPHVGAPADEVTGAALRDGAAPEDVYHRPFETLWTDLSQGQSLLDAIAAAEARLDAITSTDLQLAATHTAQHVLADLPHVVGYRRVLTNPEACGLCILASTQRYHISTLMPIHPRCDCVVAPIVGDHDPGRSINSSMLTTGAMATSSTGDGIDVYGADDLIDLGDLYEPVHKAIEATFGRRATDARKIDYRKVVLVHNHGEIGPVLTVSHHKFSKKQIDTSHLAAPPKRPKRMH